ncbi:MAG: Gfo/Idh/MocA family oxidoreductase [Gammaproteobacteria bacterium]|nr:Gfo/Idh/MocA family oxidoreductase [Gammaproteobacteria bacterium]
MQPIRTAVIGVGYLGRFHGQKYRQLPTATLVAVCDTNPATAQTVAQELGVHASTDYHSVLPTVDAVSIVVPTQQHFVVARDCLRAGKHVLLEKPMTTTVDEARELVHLAQSYKLVLQIGHLERFNPAILAVEHILKEPLFIESDRVAPFNPRGADVNVVMDLMIHDIDILLDIVGCPVTRIDAKGVAVLSKDFDIVNARIEFTNGCVANVTASRAGMKSERKMRLFQRDAYLSIDFHNKKLGIHRKGRGEVFPGIATIESEEQTFDKGDALLAEIQSFLDCIAQGKPPKVGGEDGLRALQTALEITQRLNTPPSPNVR